MSHHHNAEQYQNTKIANKTLKTVKVNTFWNDGNKWKLHSWI